MGKRIIGLFLGLISISVYATPEQKLFDYKELGWDSPRTGAETAFAVRFSDSRVFKCYQNGKVVFGFSVGVPVKGLYRDRGAAIQAEHVRKYNEPLNWDNAVAYIRFDLGVDTKSGYKRTYNSIGKPLFDSNDNLKYMVVELVNGKKIELTRFGPIPDFPFNTKKKLKPFFYYQEDDGPRYECGAIEQPD